MIGPSLKTESVNTSKDGIATEYIPTKGVLSTFINRQCTYCIYRTFLKESPNKTETNQMQVKKTLEIQQTAFYHKLKELDALSQNSYTDPLFIFNQTISYLAEKIKHNDNAILHIAKLIDSQTDKNVRLRHIYFLFKK